MIGIVQRGGDVRSRTMERVTSMNIAAGFIAENADLTCRVITDEVRLYT